MYNPYRINRYKLRKLAALNTLYKLAAFNPQQMLEGAAITGDNSGIQAVMDVDRNKQNARVEPKPSVRMNPVEVDNPNLVAGKPLTGGQPVDDLKPTPGHPTRKRRKFMRGVKVRGKWSSASEK